MEAKIMGGPSNMSLNPAKGKIIFQAEPFITLLEHVMSHENTPVLEPFCVGGSFTGNIIGDDIIITETIPFFHGTQEQVEYFENYQKALQFVKGRKDKPMGWYASRMNDHTEFTLNDIQTHHVFQNSENPKGFTIIINPAPSNDLPITLKAFRFPDIQGMTDIQQILSIPVEINPPDSTQIYQKVQRIIENFQSQKPIHQTEVAQTASTLNSPVQHLVSSSKSTITLLNVILELVKHLYQGLNSNSSKLLASLNAVVRNTQSGFSAALTEMQKIMDVESQHIRESVDQNFERVNSDGDLLTNSIDQLTEKISVDFGQLLKNILEPKLRDFKDNLVEIVEESADIGQKIEMFTDSVKGQQTTLNEFKESLEKDTSSIESSITSLKQKLDNQFAGTKKSTEKSLVKLHEEIKKIDESLKKIEKMMS